MQQASRISDKTAVFWVNEQNRAGELVECKPTIELFSNPQDQRTEGYITGRFG
jgi:phosphate transport system ATP-binding protein